jgi:hypothetical protein
MLLTKSILTVQVASRIAEARLAPASIESLQADSDQPEVQEMIRRMIHAGAVRVRPMPGCPGRVAIEPATP